MGDSERSQKEQETRQVRFFPILGWLKHRLVGWTLSFVGCGFAGKYREREAKPKTKVKPTKLFGLSAVSGCATRQIGLGLENPKPGKRREGNGRNPFWCPMSKRSLSFFLGSPVGTELCKRDGRFPPLRINPWARRLASVAGSKWV